jgi:hypothetical protein
MVVVVVLVGDEISVRGEGGGRTKDVGRSDVDVACQLPNSNSST